MASTQAPPCSSWLLLFFCVTVTLLGSCHGAASPGDGKSNVNAAASPEDRKNMYIVYMGDRPKDHLSASSLHSSMLEEVVGSDAASESWVYSYKKSFNGFVAKLTQEEVQKMAGMEGVVSVFPNRKNKLHTTRSWDFMGFNQQVKRSTIESNVIIGMLDTGIWPESDMFNDQGYGPPPTKWNGTCATSSNFTCNNKIIGAKYYYTGRKQMPKRDIESPRDTEGHGTHTSSTAAGRAVSQASLFGLGLGTARGGVPSARIAVYKICWSDGCSDADILAAFDDAIADGVDIISLSVGGFFPVDYFEDSIAIGAFHAMKNGILTSNSAGNEGPRPRTITNFSPWSLSVAASTIDRKFTTTVQLGNGKEYTGISINTFDGKMYPMIYGGDAPNTTGGFDGSQSRYCDVGTLDKSLVNGKIVLCDALGLSEGAVLAGAAGSVMQMDDFYSDVAFSFPLPATYLGTVDGAKVSQYLNSTKSPTANISKSSTVTDKIAPTVVSFSSRGPNPITIDLLKPDLSAPGVDIIAAWSPLGSVSGSDVDNRVTSYNIISGTSMSCPHATGAAAYVKSFHPTWSPAAIKSALMTTAMLMSATPSTPEAEFAYGAGHINPVGAITPGLVYDAGEIDYVKMLCGQGYDTKTLQLVTGDKSTCSSNGTIWDFNYPSFALTVNSSIPFKQSFSRTVTNVGSPGSIYTAMVPLKRDLKVTVVPSTISFKSLGQKQSFVVTVEGTIDGSSSSSSAAMISTSLSWFDGVYAVRSPIVISTFSGNS